MPTKSGKIRYSWSVCVLLGMFMYMMIALHLSYIHRRNLVIMMKGIGIAISTFGAILKVGTFLFNRRSLINYHRTLNDLFEEELARNEKTRTIMLSFLPTMCILAYTYSAIMLGLVLAYCVPPYLVIIRDLCHLRLTTNYTLPVSRRYGHFWPVPDNFLYHFHLLFETILFSLVSTTAASVECAFGFYVYQFASTMHAMTFRLTNPLPNEKFSDVLRTCVEKHQKLLQCRDTLEHNYGPIVFWHIVSNAVLLCSLIYEAMSYSSLNVTNISAFLTFASVKLFQSFMYSWYGTVLTNAGDDFRKGIYFGEWPNSDLNHHVRTSVILMMMQKPMTINAFFAPVEMVMFTNFINTTMSYFFLLRSVGDKHE
ncbi:odorant receptor 13a-like [Temnothorax nylanderi]|uniref:odorant receptor 13a-like n=1 Tax=Temnothorax nylanderi TaxID=102681 RepID=UPI003A8C7176